jgi:lipopolysaccharide exporter
MITEIFNDKKNHFAQNILKLFSGNVIANIIQLATIPILARLYSPDDFGILGLFLSVGAILTSLSSFKYTDAIILTQKCHETVNTVWLCMVITVVYCLLIIFSFILCYYFGLSIFGDQKYDFLLCLLPFHILVNSQITIFRQLSMKLEKFGIVAKSEIFKILIYRGSAIGWPFFFAVSPLWLIFSSFLGSIIMLFTLLNTSAKYVWNCRNEISRKSMRIIASRYKKFPLYSSWTGLLLNLNVSLLPILIAHFYSLQYAGYFIMARNICSRPIRALSNAIGPAYYQRIATFDGHKQKLLRFSVKFYKFLVPAALAIFMAYFFLSEYFILPLLGDKWGPSKFAILPLSFYWCSRLLTKPLTYLLKLANSQEKNLIAELINLFITGSLFMLFAHKLTFINILWIYCLLNTIVTLSIYLYSTFSYFRRE